MNASNTHELSVPIKASLLNVYQDVESQTVIWRLCSGSRSPKHWHTTDIKSIVILPQRHRTIRVLSSVGVYWMFNADSVWGVCDRARMPGATQLKTELMCMRVCG